MAKIFLECPPGATFQHYERYPMAVARKKVLMLVMNEFVFDARVLKTAESISALHEVMLVGIRRRKVDLDQATERKKWPFRTHWVDFGDPLRPLPNYASHGIRYWQTFQRIRSLGIDFRPDIVHAHDLSALPIARTIQKATGAHLIYDAHELYRDSLGFPPVINRAQGWLETRNMKHCDGIIACNQPRAEIMYREYGAPMLPSVVPNMPKYFPYEASDLLMQATHAERYGVSRLVLYQGVLMPGRGLELLPQALPLLSPQLGVVLMGTGSAEYIDKLKDLAISLSVKGRFFILPAVPQSELFPYTCSAHAGLVIYQNTCRNNYFCAPNKLYEYTAAGVPTVGADLPTIRQFIENEAVGSLFNPDSPQELARAITEVIGSESAHTQFRANCLRCAPFYSWESVSEKELYSLYEKIINENDPARRDARSA